MSSMKRLGGFGEHVKGMRSPKPNDCIGYKTGIETWIKKPAPKK